jgi:hypothetical protein
MPDGVLTLWVVGVTIAFFGLVVHAALAIYYGLFVRWLRQQGRETKAARGWVRDEVYRLGLKVLLVLWGVSRWFLIRERAPEAAMNPHVQMLDATTLLIYFGFLLWLNHWTWTVNYERNTSRRPPEGETDDLHC